MGTNLSNFEWFAPKNGTAVPKGVSGVPCTAGTKYNTEYMT